MKALLDFLKKYRAGFITNFFIISLPFISILRYHLWETDPSAGAALGFFLIFTFMGLMVFDIVCGIVAIFMRSKTKEEAPLPGSYNFFLGFFLAGLFLFSLVIVIIGAINAFAA